MGVGASNSFEYNLQLPAPENSGISARLEQKKCVHSASVRCENLVTWLKLLVKSKLRTDPSKEAPGVEITHNLRKGFMKELQNLSARHAQRI